ncbi:enoyl-CoA hydratase/isomerase family protein [Niallia endozanthoxylica]|uniref:Enoyl-CoA hydratase/isomerase family protein n=1 Tax=Niallia endozanthoxylica TaxID=2036016 RepID=A0A5J5HYM1_9BACI|nr:enoyl-CoA hydratase/isomerase family protein [Niallia endozanthoxylica]KAA9027055.1 enoyl-CoA hydratase/isomerase family protein [Niallia endozanthoxylica]
MKENHILVDIQDHVATITLNRPEKHNALTGDMMEDFVSILNELNQNSDVRVLLVTGAGEKSFCSGADLGGMSENNDQHILTYKKHVSKYKNCLLAIHQLKKPIVAAVNGYALAGGLGLAAVCDITLAKESALFGAPEINVGLWGMMISAPLIRTIGSKKTYELFYTGKKITAFEAKEIGLVNTIYPDNELIEEATQFARQLAKRNPTALTLGREAMQMIQGMDYEKSLNYLRDQVVILGETEDSKEGMNAFLEKREPVWSGR